MSDQERKPQTLRDDRPVGNIPPELFAIYGRQPEQAGAVPQEEPSVPAEAVQTQLYARERRLVIFSLLGLGAGVVGLATGVIKIDLTEEEAPTPPDPIQKPKIPPVNKYQVVTEVKEEELTSHLSQEPYKIVGDPRLKTDSGYTVQTLVKERETRDVQLSEAWKKVLSSPYTAEDCYTEVDLIKQNDPQGAKEVAEFLLKQMKTVLWEEGDFAIRMGLLAMNLDPAAHDQAIMNIEFLDALWEEQRNQQFSESEGEPAENFQPESKTQSSFETEYVLSTPSESPIDPEKIKQELKNQKNLKLGLRINFGLSLIGPVEYARVLASRAGIISSMDKQAGTGAVYEITEAVDLGLSLNGLPVKYLKVKVVSGAKMPEGILWFISATEMKEKDKFFGWRAASVVTG